MFSSCKFYSIVISVLSVGVICIQVSGTSIHNGNTRVDAYDNNENDYFCPLRCDCSDLKFVKCAHARLKHVPRDLPKSALIIDLSHNAIRELHSEDFVRFGEAIEIDLSNNELIQIDKEAFVGLECLQRLRLTNNKLKSLAPDTFHYAKNLKLLDLSNNSIVVPPKGSFLHQPNLEELYCNNCSVEELNEVAFENLHSLKTLELENNFLKSKINAQAFLPLKNLMKLKLSKLDSMSIEELCTVLEPIDIMFFNISCSKLAMDRSGNESVISNSIELNIEPVTVSKPSTKLTNVEETLTETTVGSDESSNVLTYMILLVIGVVVGGGFWKDIGGIKSTCSAMIKYDF